MTTRQGRSLSRLSLVVLLAPVLGCEQLPAAPDTNVAPTAAFFFTPVSPVYAGQSSVLFNATGSRDEDGEIADYTWDFGDGTSRVSGGGPSVRHTFPDTPARCLEVTYGVSLTVTDDKGMSAIVAERVTVIELPAPTASECK